MFRNNRNSASRDCRRDEARAVGFVAGNGDEHVAALDGTAVRRHPANVEIGMAWIEVRIRRQNLAKLHLKLLGGSVDNAAKALPVFLHRGQYLLIGRRQIEARLDAQERRDA